MWISLIFLLTYMIYVGVTVGITPTLSESFYRVKYKWAFTIALWGTGFTLLPEWLNYSDTNFQFLAFLACGALCFIGASPAFKESLSRQVHMGGLITCIITLMAWCICSGLWIIPTICVTAGLLLSLKFKQCWGYIMECSAFLTAYLSVFVSKYLL